MNRFPRSASRWLLLSLLIATSGCATVLTHAIDPKNPGPCYVGGLVADLAVCTAVGAAFGPPGAVVGASVGLFVGGVDAAIMGK